MWMQGLTSMDLFSLFLGSALSGVASTAAGAIVKVLAGCFACSQQDEERIANRSFNIIECRNCHKQAKQFTNACEATINPANLQIGQVGVEFGQIAYSSKEWSQRWGFLWLEKSSGISHEFSLPLRVQFESLKGRSVVLETLLCSYDDDSLLGSSREVFAVRDARELRDDVVIRPVGDAQKVLLKHEVLACDVRVLSAHRDVLFQDRTLMQYKGT